MKQISLTLLELTFPLYKPVSSPFEFSSFVFSLDPESLGFYFPIYKMDQKNTYFAEILWK